MQYELEIVLRDSIDRTERQGRLMLLKKIMYYSNLYRWQGLLFFYAAWLHKIEFGQTTWANYPSSIEVPVLALHVVQPSQQSVLHDKFATSPNTECVWF